MSGALGVGIIGCGNVTTRYHLPAYRSLANRVRVVALADLEPARLAEAQYVAGVGDERTYRDYHELMGRPDVDVIDICTPQSFHAQIAEAAAAAGKHILCEKPITTVPADAARMLSRANEAGVFVATMHNYLFYPEFVAARQVIDSGEIGAVRLAIVNYLGVVDLPGAGETAANWRHDPVAAGGGVLADMLHALYVAESLLGRPVLRISAWVSGNDRHPLVEATALCRLETDGPVALVNVGWGIGPGGVFIEGDRGSLELRWQDGGTNPFVPLEWMEVRTADGRRRIDVPCMGLPEIHVEGMRGLIEDFADAIETGRRPRAAGEDGLHVLELTLGAYESAALGRTVEVPLDRSDPVFLGGVAAIPGMDGPAWSPVFRQRLYANQPQS